MSYSQIAPWERYAIAALLAARFNRAQIAHILGRHRSTIGRELRRNAARSTGWYSAKLANDYTRTRRWRTREHSQYSAGQWRQVERLLEGWLSPEQIAGHLQRLGLFSICHETIYRYVRADRREGGTLYLNLRQSHRRRRKRYERRGPRAAHPFKRHIDDRPGSAERRAMIGHWEIDTMAGPDPSGPCVLTLVERASGYVALGFLRARTAADVNARAIELIRAQPRPVLTITADNGSEFAGFPTIEQATGVRFYFTNPYHAWERGTNENTNGLIRQFLPKGQSLANLTQRECTRIARVLNQRPRKRLRYRTPEACYVPRS